MNLFEGPYAALLGSPQVVQMMQGNANSKLPPSDPRMHYRPILPEIGWYDPNLPQPRGWETFEQVPRFHPDARLPHPFGPQSYPRIHMESLRDFRIRTKPPAPWVDRLKVAVESELDWIKRYPGIEGGTLSEEEIAKGCGKRPPKESGEPIKVCIVIRDLENVPADWEGTINWIRQDLIGLILQELPNPPVAQSLETTVVQMGVLQDLPKIQSDVDRLEAVYPGLENQHLLIFPNGGPTLDPIFVTDFLKGRYTNGRPWLGEMAFVDLPSNKYQVREGPTLLRELCNWAEEAPKLDTRAPIWINFVHYFFEEVLKRQMTDEHFTTPGWIIPEGHEGPRRWTPGGS